MKASIHNNKVTFTDTDGMYWTRELTAEERAIVEAISHGDGQAVAQGWKLVPVKLDDDMAVAFCEVWFSKRRCIDDAEMDDAYAALLGAVPANDATPMRSQVDATLHALQADGSLDRGAIADLIVRLAASPPAPSVDRADAVMVPVELTDEMYKAWKAFVAEVGYLEHPAVPYEGTEYGDSEEAWERRLFAATYKCVLNAAVLSMDAALKGRSK